MRKLLLLLVLVLPLTAQDAPYATITPGTPDLAAGTLPFRVTVVNPLPEPIAFAFQPYARDLRDRSDLPIAGPDLWNCEGSSDSNCTWFRPMAAQSQLTFDYTLTFPQRAGRTYIEARFGYALANQPSLVTLAEPVLVSMARPFSVTSTADSDEGSLRNALLAVNAEPVCATLPCRIEFHISGTGAWQTIAPLTPLPRLIAGDVELDATTQADTNPLGPDVQLLGTNLNTGDALDLQADQLVVRGLAIGGFPGSGIFYRPKMFGSIFLFERNFIGVDPTGTMPVHNGSRGITVEEGVVSGSLIRENVLSGNGRSGIYVTTERNQFGPLSPVIRIENNRIGVAAAGDAPIPNHASGIFLGPESEWVRVANNVIAHNKHFGVAIARGGTNHVVAANRMLRNGQSGIDHGLDGPDASGRAVLLSATYEAATNTTIVRGQGEPHEAWLATYQMVYASDEADAEGELFLGEVLVPTTGTFEFRVTGDYRGKYITSVKKTVIDLLWTATGEFSAPIQVQ